MKKTIKNMEINYTQYGNNKGENIILLHGWGQNIEMMKPLGDHLEDYHITILDFPGLFRSCRRKGSFPGIRTGCSARSGM